ncbi:MAG TPA: tetratricopeptide repeat protein [Candidatus Eisenbacteria bacterium]|nr:tetratricopeptide repeat protein [Candidatus Eisenbacteria bacterium]
MATQRPKAKRGGPGGAGGGGSKPASATRPRAGGVRGFRLPSIDRALLLVLLFAAAIRIWGIGDRLPDASLGINVIDDTAIEETDRTTIMRSWGMWRGGTKPLDLNPHTGGWPALSFYLTLAIQLAYKAWYGLVHPGVSAAIFADHVQRDAAALFLLARLVNAAIGVLSVALAWRLALPLGGRLAAILAALFLAANPLHVLTSQHISDPNLLALLFVALAAIAMARVAEGGGLRDSVWAGIWIGLAGACKYVPVVLVLPLALAHARGFRWRAFAIAAVVAVAAMFVASPFTFLDWKTTSDAFLIQRRSLFSDWVGQSAFPISLPTYLIASLPKALGWPVYLLSIVGTVLLWRRGAAGRTVALVPIAVVLANGMLRAAQERYMLVAFPMLMAGAGIAIAAAWARWRDRVPAALRAGGAVGAIALVAVAWPMPDLWNVRSALRRPDSRHEARRWVNANVPPERRLAIEIYGPVFHERERNFVIWPFFATQAPLVAAAYHHEFLDGIETIVLSGEISRRFDADSLKYPGEAAYYRWLRANGTVLWRSDPERLSGPSIEVRALPAAISTRAERDSLFARLEAKPSRTYRLALWCHDLSALFARSGRFDRAEEWALRGLHVNATNLNPRLHAALALARMNLEDFEGTLAAAEAGLKASPRTHALQLYRGTALQNLGRSEEALEAVRAAYAGLGDPRILLNVGQILASMGRHEEAVAELARVPAEVPERAAARRDMAVILLNHLRRRDEGIAALREAAALAQDPGEARLLMDEVARLERAIPPSRTAAP